MIQKVPTIHLAPILQTRNDARPTKQNPAGKDYPAVTPTEVVKVEEIWDFSSDNPHMPIGEFIRVLKARNA